MKKFQLFTICTLFGFYSIAQISFTDVAYLNLPKKAKKLSKDQVQEFAKGKTQYLKEIDRSRGDFYKVNSMMLQLNAAVGATSKDHLERHKKSFDAMAKDSNGKQSAHYTSVIKMINNYKVLIIHQESQNWAFYSFFSFNLSNTSALTGTIEYDKSDKASKNKAAKTLDTLLQSIKFK